jgi:hypothetical protein
MEELLGVIMPHDRFKTPLEVGDQIVIIEPSYKYMTDAIIIRFTEKRIVVNYFGGDLSNVSTLMSKTSVFWQNVIKKPIKENNGNSTCNPPPIK